MADVDLTTVDYFEDTSLMADPCPYYEAVRGRGPVWQEPHHGAFVVTGYDEIQAIYRDPDTFSSCNSFGGPFPGLPEVPDGEDASALIEAYRHIYPSSESFITFDPPLHTAHRGLMMGLLTPRRLQENEAFMWRAADQQIDRFVDRHECEFASEYAQPFAMLVIADLLGVPEADQPRLRERFVARGAAGTVGRQLQGNFLEFLEDVFTEYVDDRRARPLDDVLTQMAQATFPDGGTPDPVDVVRVATLLFAGGQGTAGRFHIATLKLLAEDATLQEELRRDPSLIPNFVEEVLRFQSPTKVNFRMARRATELAGVPVPAGSTLMLLLGAADRDPRRFECPELFRAGRPNAREHVAFGRGPHSCPGGPLVRAEARITLERVLARLGDIRLSTAYHGSPDAPQFEYTPSYILQGVEALHLEFTPTG